MSEWLSNSLGELVTFQKGRKVATSPYPLENYAAYLGASRLSGASEGYGSKFLAVTADEHDVLMLWDGERSGLCRTGLSGVVSSTVAKLSPIDSINSLLLYYLLLYNFQWIQNRRTGTGVPHVPKDLGKILRLTYPKSKQEQQKIVRILQTIDQTIEKTEALIGKYQQIKAGLMHDLFTRGIGPDGKLRPPREQAPELYQETPIGWISKEWDYKSLKEIFGSKNITNGPFGSDLLTSELKKEGTPVLYCQDIKPGVFERVSSSNVTELKAAQLSFCNVRNGDILLAKVGSPPCDSCIYDKEEVGVVTQDVIRIRPSKQHVPSFFSSWFNTGFGRKAIRRISIEGTRERVSLGEFKELLVPVANFDEQLEIGNRIDSLQISLTQSHNELRKLQKQKIGLMHDLLTGKVPVQVESEAKPEAVNA